MENDAFTRCDLGAGLAHSRKGEWHFLPIATRNPISHHMDVIPQREEIQSGLKYAYVRLERITGQGSLHQIPGYSDHTYLDPKQNNRFDAAFL